VIPPAALEFLRGLAANNDKAWFEANRATYESAVRAPVAALVVSVATELARRFVPLEGDPKRSIFRIHRDVRFSRDKSPYKTNIGTLWYRQGGGKAGGGVLYFHVAPDGCFAAAGFYMPEPEALDSIRERIRVQADKFQAMEAALAAEGLALGEGDPMSRMPRGFEDLKGSAVDPAIRMRSFMVRKPLPARVVHGKGLPTAIASFGAASLPLLRFGWDAIDEVQAGSARK
jgi:uncharacterized protein (TIGR02453 family)